MKVTLVYVGEVADLFLVVSYVGFYGTVIIDTQCAVSLICNVILLSTRKITA